MTYSRQKTCNIWYISWDMIVFSFFSFFFFQKSMILEKACGRVSSQKRGALMTRLMGSLIKTFPSLSWGCNGLIIIVIIISQTATGLQPQAHGLRQPRSVKPCRLKWNQLWSFCLFDVEFGHFSILYTHMEACVEVPISSDQPSHH